MLNVCTHKLKEKGKLYTRENICMKQPLNYFKNFDILENLKKMKILLYIYMYRHAYMHIQTHKKTHM